MKDRAFRAHFSDPNGIVAYLVLNGTDPASWLCTLRSSVSLSLSHSPSPCLSVSRSLSPLYLAASFHLCPVFLLLRVSRSVSIFLARTRSLFLCPSPLDILPLAATVAATAAARHPREVSIYTESRHDRIHKYVHSLALLVHSYQLSTRKHCCIVPCSVISVRAVLFSFFLTIPNRNEFFLSSASAKI